MTSSRVKGQICRCGKKRPDLFKFLSQFADKEQMSKEHLAEWIMIHSVSFWRQKFYVWKRKVMHRREFFIFPDTSKEIFFETVRGINSDFTVVPQKTLQLMRFAQLPGSALTKFSLNPAIFRAVYNTSSPIRGPLQYRTGDKMVSWCSLSAFGFSIRLTSSASLKFYHTYTRNLQHLVFKWSVKHICVLHLMLFGVFELTRNRLSG